MVAIEVAKSIKNLLVFMVHAARFVYAKHYVLSTRHYEKEWSWTNELIFTLMFPKQRLKANLKEFVGYVKNMFKFGIGRSVRMWYLKHKFLNRITKIHKKRATRDRDAYEAMKKRGSSRFKLADHDDIFGKKEQIIAPETRPLFEFDENYKQMAM